MDEQNLVLQPSIREIGSGDAYADLKLLVTRKRLLDKRPAFYARKIIINFCLLSVGVACLVTVKDFRVQLLNATFLAFVFTQLGFIVHDAGHQQLLATRWKNDVIGILHANLLLGFSYQGWVVPHNVHHSRPNEVGVDPDTKFRVLAFTEAQARQRRGLLRWLTAYQHYLFFGWFLLETVNLRATHIRFLLLNRIKHRALEVVCLCLHCGFYFGIIFHSLSVGEAVIFVVINQAIFGLYLGLVIAPNHIGMPLVTDAARMDFVRRQVLPTRNIRRHPLVDYCFGPLCCQIEHHLFPSMPLKKLREAQDIVQPYCETHGIPYHETGLLDCYREILSHLKKASAPIRERT